MGRQAAAYRANDCAQRSTHQTWFQDRNKALVSPEDTMIHMAVQPRLPFSRDQQRWQVRGRSCVCRWWHQCVAMSRNNSNSGAHRCSNEPSCGRYLRTGASKDSSCPGGNTSPDGRLTCTNRSPRTSAYHRIMRRAHGQFASTATRIRLPWSWRWTAAPEGLAAGAASTSGALAWALSASPAVSVALSRRPARRSESRRDLARSTTWAGVSASSDGHRMATTVEGSSRHSRLNSTSCGAWPLSSMRLLLRLRCAMHPVLLTRALHPEDLDHRYATYTGHASGVSSRTSWQLQGRRWNTICLIEG